MNMLTIVVAFAVAFLGIEIFFFAACFRWLAAGKRARERDFARLDHERMELLQLQRTLRQDMEEAKGLAAESVNKLRLLGSEAHAEWTEMSERLQNVVGEVESNCHRILDESTGVLTRQRLSLEKSCKDSLERETALVETLRSAERVLRFFDRNIPVDQILKDLQTEKYAEARTLMEQGLDASSIARKLGMSLNEVALLSHMR